MFGIIQNHSEDLKYTCTVQIGLGSHRGSFFVLIAIHLRMIDILDSNTKCTSYFNNMGIHNKIILLFYLENVDLLKLYVIVYSNVLPK